MDKHICKAKCKSSVSWRKNKDEDWVYGYYVKANDEYGGGITHAIISTDCRYRGGAEYDYWEWHEVDPDTVCRNTGMTEFVMIDKSVRSSLFEGDIVEVHSVRCPYAGYPQSKHDGPVKVRAVIHFQRGQWQLDYDNAYNNKMCEPRGKEQDERAVNNSWELYYFGYKGKPEHEDQYREMNKRYHYGDIVKLGNIHDNPELLEG